MPVQRSQNIDLQTEEVCTFLRNHNQQEFDYGYDEDFYTTNGNYSTPKAILQFPIINDEDRNLILNTCVIQEYEIVEKKTSMQYTIGKTITRIDHSVSLNPYAILLLQNGIDEKEAEKLVGVFKEYDLLKDDLDDMETDIVKSGISTKSYQVLLSYKLNRLGAPIANSDHDQEYKKVVNNSEKYIFKRIKEYPESCEVPDLTFENNSRVGEVDDISEEKEILSEISRMGKEVNEFKECFDLKPVAHRVGTLVQYPEYKIVWEPRDIRIGKCRIVRTKMPIPYTRTRKQVLYCYVLSNDDMIKVYEKIFIYCLKESAIVAGLLFIVMGGEFNTAVAAFKVNMKACLSRLIQDQFQRCIVPEMGIVAEKSIWHRV